jgi:hypothetical protein
MLQLRRVRLRSIGHPNARFAPLDLDLVGEDGRPTHTVLWLRNGGGKSSLLNLLFAVVRPNRREFLGANDDGKDRRLGDYVLDGDTAHVCIEWGRPGERSPALITGMALEWRDRTRSADESRLRRLWYAFVPSDHRDPGLLPVEPTLTFDALPTSEDGRRLPLARFRERLRALGATDPSLRLVTPASQAEWRRELEQHDLDPEVLRYQLQMNREEGGASELFKRRCRSAGDFVDLLLELAVADERTDRVADVYLRYADELRRRPDVERNHEFLTGALDRLEPVADLDRRSSSADRELATTLADAGTLAAGLRSAAREHADRAAAAEARAADRRRQATDADERARDADDEAAAADRAAAGLDVDTAQRALDDAEAELAAAGAHLAAVGLLEPLAHRRELDAEIATLDAQLDVDAPASVGQLAAVRRRLARRLRADIARAAEHAGAARIAAARCQDEAATAARRADEAIGAHGRLVQAHTDLQQRATAWRARVDALVARGDVGADGDVAAALTAARAAVADAQRARADRDRRHDEAQQAVRDAYARLADVDAQLGDARARVGASAHDQEQMYAAAAALADDDRVRALAETNSVDLWHVGATLAERLDMAAADVDRQLADHAVAVAADRAALLALQTDGLLPPRAAAAEVVAVLRARSVDAIAGWRHLAGLGADERERLLRQAPAAADGVVVRDAGALAVAREALGDADAPWRAAIAVVAADGLPAAAGPDDAALLVAPVDPALVDRAQAGRARDRLERELAAADGRRATMASARDHDAALADRLRRLLRTYPPARRRRIDEDAELARRDVERLREERDAVAAEAARLSEAREATAGGPADDGVAHRTTLAAELAALAEGHVDADQIAAVAQRAADARERAEAAQRDAARAGQRAAEHLITAQRHADDADRLRDELAALAADARDDLDDDSDRADDGEAETAEVLRRRARVLEATARAERSTGTLAERRHLLAEQRADVARTVTAAEPAVLRSARALLDGPDGADRRARAAAARAAERRRDTALERRAGATERLRTARDRLERMPVSAAALEVATADDARQLAATARERAGRARRAADAATADAGRAEADARGLRQLGDRFDHLAELLAVELRARPTTTTTDDAVPAIVPGDPDAARARIGELRARIDEHAARADRAARDVAAAAAEVRRFVGDDRFATLDGPIRTRLTADPVAVVRGAGDEVTQLRMRRDQCGQQLDELRAHRRLLVREIAADAQRGLWLLRQADRVSALPAGFGAWSEQRFLHIRFATPAVDEELFVRLEEMVDRLVDEGVRPAGVPLLQRAVHAAAGADGFDVAILKPNPALQPQRVPVTELATFSGGEQLTAAILLYCTLARLRAQTRQAQTSAGVLTLDNPIGKSSNVTLLQLQRRVADAMGVQLVYTTAVDDREAVAVLPHWIRLRNERRDQRSGNLHVERSDDVRAATEHGVVAATHLWRRGDVVEPVPGGR